MCPEDDGSVSLELERFAEMYDGPLDYFLPDRSPGPVDLVDTGSRGITRSKLLSRAAPGPPGSRLGGEGEARVRPGVGLPAFGVSSECSLGWVPSIPWGGTQRKRARGESDEPPHSDCRPGTMRRGFRPTKPQNRGSPPITSPITCPASRVVTGSAPRGECGVSLRWIFGGSHSWCPPEGRRGHCAPRGCLAIIGDETTGSVGPSGWFVSEPGSPGPLE